MPFLEVDCFGIKNRWCMWKQGWYFTV